MPRLVNGQHGLIQFGFSSISSSVEKKGTTSPKISRPRFPFSVNLTIAKSTGPLTVTVHESETMHLLVSGCEYMACQGKQSMPLEASEIISRLLIPHKLKITIYALSLLTDEVMKCTKRIDSNYGHQEPCLGFFSIVRCKSFWM